MGQKKITNETIKTYLELDKEIQILEKQNVGKNQKIREDQLKFLKEEKKSLELQYEQCKIITAKEKSDVDKMKNQEDKIIAQLSKSKFDEQMGKETAEYLEALSKEQTIEKQLKGIPKRIKEIEDEIEKNQPQVDVLNKLCEDREKLLSDIFKGSYGSDLENELEAKLDPLIEKRQRIGVAKYKWTNGRVLLQHAVNQLSFATQKWKDLDLIDKQDTKATYSCATESRNNVQAAIQNLQNTQKYLNNIEFPYCKPPEVDTLKKVVDNMYIDMTTTNRRSHAYECLHVTHQRAYALLQWFENVLNEVIEKDFRKASEEERECSRALREERLRLMIEEVEKNGEKCNVDAIKKQIRGQEDFDDSQVEQEISGLTDADDVPGAEGSSRDMPPPTPLPLKNLAQLPTKDELFGNVSKITEQYEKENAELDKVQDLNKQRLDQGLEEKLAARRNRRMRTQVKC